MNILFVDPVVVPKPEELSSFYIRIMDVFFNFRKRYLFNKLTFQQLAAVTPKKYSIQLLDERFQKIDFDDNFDVVVITSKTQFIPHAYRVADKFRKKGKIVIFIGEHASLVPTEAKQHSDSVIIGETEEIWPTVLEDIEKKDLKPFYKSIKTVDLKNLPPPHRDFIKKSLLIARIEATRGCPYSCNFCRIPSIQGNTFRKKPIENVIEDIKSIQQRYLFFEDASLTLDPEYTKELFRNMIGLKKKFSCCGNVDVLAKDDELVELSKKAGCIGWYVGFESFSRNTLNSIGKETNKVEEYKLVVEKIHSHKMAAYGTFIVGFDDDEVFNSGRMLKFINDLKVDGIELNFLTPFPGTPLFNQMDKENRILTRDWSKYYEGVVVFKPKYMTPEELKQKADKIFLRFYPFRYSIIRILRSMKLGFYPFLWTIMQNSSWV